MSEFVFDDSMQNAINPPRMCTIQQTARLLGLHTHFIRMKVLSGEIVAVKAGRTYYVNVDKLIEYLNTSYITPEEEGCSGITPIPTKL